MNSKNTLFILLSFFTFAQTVDAMYSKATKPAYILNKRNVNAIQLGMRNLSSTMQQHDTARAKEFLSKVTNNDKLTYRKAELIKYLQKRVQNSSATRDEKDKEISRTLCSQWCLLFVLNHLDTNTSARIMFYFPQMVEENLAFKLCRELSCYTADLTEHNQPYASTLQKVTEEEYRKKLDEKFNKDALQAMMLDESKKLAENVLLLLDSTSKSKL